MSKPIRIVLGALMAGCAGVPAWADDRALCLDKQVEACTRLIDSEKQDQANRANLFTVRGSPTTQKANSTRLLPTIPRLYVSILATQTHSSIAGSPTKERRTGPSHRRRLGGYTS